MVDTAIPKPIHSLRPPLGHYYARTIQSQCQFKKGYSEIGKIRMVWNQIFSEMNAVNFTQCFYFSEREKCIF